MQGRGGTTSSGENRSSAHGSGHQVLRKIALLGFRGVGMLRQPFPHMVAPGNLNTAFFFSCASRQNFDCTKASRKRF